MQFFWAGMVVAVYHVEPRHEYLRVCPRETYACQCPYGTQLQQLVSWYVLAVSMQLSMALVRTALLRHVGTHDKYIQ